MYVEPEDAETMASGEHTGGFSLDASVRVVEAADRQGLERLLRTCARPPLAPEGLAEVDADHLRINGLRAEQIYPDERLTPP